MNTSKSLVPSNALREYLQRESHCQTPVPLDRPTQYRVNGSSAAVQPMAQNATGGEATLLVYSEAEERQWRETAMRRAIAPEDRISSLINQVPRGALTRCLSPAPSQESLDSIQRRFPHFRKVTDCIRLHAALAISSTGLRLPPILLGGPPGLGKTAYVRALSNLLKSPLLEANMASNTAGFRIGGLDMRWSSGSPGLIFEALVLDDPVLPANRVLLIDEIDKSAVGNRQDSMGSFYSLLEPSTARQFRDEAAELPIDASAIIYIATANDVDLVPTPILSRMELFEIAKPHLDELPAIVLSVWQDLRSEEGWWAQRFAQDLDPQVVDKLASAQCAREIGANLRRAAGRAALEKRDRIEARDVVLDASRGSRRLSRIGF